MSALDSTMKAHPHGAFATEIGKCIKVCLLSIHLKLWKFPNGREIFFLDIYAKDLLNFMGLLIDKSNKNYDLIPSVNKLS